MKSVAQIFDAYIDEISELIDAFPFEDRDSYCQWMNQQYHLVRNSSRYLAMAASVVPIDQSEEFRWWAHHLAEETDHDKTLFKDMRALGHDSKDEMLPETRALIGAQYFDIQKNGADALLGYALLLEGLSCKRCEVVAQRVEIAHGGRSTYLRLHGEVDQGHYPMGLKRVESMSDARKKIIVDNLHMSARLYIHLQNHLLQRCMKVQFAKAA
jgi:hypothetical protein